MEDLPKILLDMTAELKTLNNFLTFINFFTVGTFFCISSSAEYHRFMYQIQYT